MSLNESTDSYVVGIAEIAIGTRPILASMRLTPRLAGSAALLALLPAIAFGVAINWWAGAITLVNIIIIEVSLYLLMSPTESEGHGGHDDGGADEAV
jgi:hypothetical protein